MTNPTNPSHLVYYFTNEIICCFGFVFERQRKVVHRKTVQEFSQKKNEKQVSFSRLPSGSIGNNDIAIPYVIDQLRVTFPISFKLQEQEVHHETCKMLTSPSSSSSSSLLPSTSMDGVLLWSAAAVTRHF